MPASKRRLAADRALAEWKAAQARATDGAEHADMVEPDPVDAAEPVKAADPVEAPAVRRRSIFGPRPQQEPRPQQVSRPRTRPVREPLDPSQEPWKRLPLAALLGLVLIVEVLVGLISHIAFHRNRLIFIDLFFFNAVLALPATLALAPLVKRLLHQPRHLRWLESLSLGAVYALIVTLVTLSFLHSPAKLPANATADQLMDSLGTSDVPGLAVADVLSILLAAQVFPGLSRILSAPGRRAKKRLEERAGKPAATRRVAGSPRARAATARRSTPAVAEPRRRGKNSGKG